MCRVLGVRTTSQLRLVLEVLLSDPEGKHWGFGIMKTTGLTSGTVYVILARLEGEGWVTSDWADPEGSSPRRRFYQLTPEGIKGARNRLEKRPSA